MPNRVCGVLILAWCIVIAGVSCGGGPTTPDPPPPPPPQYEHAITVQALTLHTDAAVTGDVKVTMRSTGQVYNGTIGQKITLATTTRREELCDVLIQANGCLPREYTEVGVTDNTLNTNVVEMSAIDWPFLVYIMPDGVNRSWTPRKFDVYFNPDPLTGLRLDSGYVDAIEEAIQYVANNSKGYIQSVTFDELANKPLDTSVPPEGEIWVYRRSDVPGIGNITYPSSEVKVLSSKIFVNQGSTIPQALPAETYDALFGAGQEFGNNPSIGPFFTIMLNRPRDTNTYRINTLKETQKGIDIQTTFTSVAVTSVDSHLRIKAGEELPPSSPPRTVTPAQTTTRRPPAKDLRHGN